MEVKINTQPESGSETFDYNMSWEGSEIVSISPDANIRDAAKLMRDEQVGDVLVMETESEGGSLLGIITDRDVASPYRTITSRFELQFSSPFCIFL